MYLVDLVARSHNNINNNKKEMNLLKRVLRFECNENVILQF